MFARYISITVAIASAITLGYVLHTQAVEPQPGPYTWTPLLQARQSWYGEPYEYYPNGQPELTIKKFVIAANTELPWHLHPVPSAAYIISGTLTVESQDGTVRKVFKPGEALASPVNILHRGVSGDQPVELVVFYAGTPDMPTVKIEK